MRREVLDFAAVPRCRAGVAERLLNCSIGGCSGPLDAYRDRHSADHRDADENDPEKAVETAAARMLVFLLFWFLNLLCGHHSRHLVPPA